MTEVNDRQQFNPVDITFTREEVLLLQHLFERQLLYGLEEEPWHDLTEEQQLYGIIYAERSLRARGVAFVDPESGRLLVQKDLLNALGIALFAPKIVVVHQFRGAELQFKLVGYLFEEQAISLRYPAPALYRFTTAESPAKLIDDFVSLTMSQEATVTFAGLTLSAPPTSIEDLRIAVEQNNLPAAKMIFATTPHQQSAEELITALQNQHTVTNFHVLTIAGENTLQSQEFTLLDSPSSSWIMTTQAYESDPSTIVSDPMLLLTQTTSVGLRETLTTLLSVV